MVAQSLTFMPAEPIPLHEAARYLYNDNNEKPIEESAGRFQASIESDSIFIVEELTRIPGHPCATRLHKAISSF